MENTEQLRILSIFHYVLGGLEICFGCLGSLYLLMGLSLALNPMVWTSHGEVPPPPFMGWIFVAVGGMWILCGVVFGILTALSGRFIAKRRNKTFSIVIGALNCLFVPFGTLLGVFTIILLSKNEIVAMYNESASAEKVLSETGS